jgi:bifunctional non-homologous end joining protein LigD
MPEPSIVHCIEAAMGHPPMFMAAISFPSTPREKQTQTTQTNPNNQTEIMTPTTTDRNQSTSLYFRDGPSDKEYHAAIEPKGDGFIVTFAYGRRDNTLTVGTKTEDPVSLAEATKVFDKLIASKIAKGYQSGFPGRPFRPSPVQAQGRDSGIRCQLLNAVEESELPRLLGDKQHCLQEKHDGRRMLVRKQDYEISGINRRGLIVALPEPIREATSRIPFDVVLDGEAVGETLYIFDLLEVNGNDLRPRGYLHRYSGLLALLDPAYPALRPVSTVVEPADKLKMFETFRQNNREGVVFKDIDAPYSPGRPNTGGTQLKFKFVESASFIVTARNAKRSVALGLFDSNGDGNTLVPAGNVTIPPNHAVPAVGEVIETKYLYAHRQSGSIYQPVYMGKRCDIPASECTTDQLKYKSDVEAAA